MCTPGYTSPMCTLGYTQHGTQVSYPAWYTGVIPGMVPGGIPGMYLGGIPGMYLGGIPTLVCTPYLPWYVHPTHPGIYPPIHPGYTLYTTTPAGATSAAQWVSAVQDNEALGSNLRLIREKRLSGIFWPSVVLGLVCPSAQSYSRSPVRKTERLDRRRVNPL